MGFKGNLKQLSKLRSIAPNGSRERIDNVIKLYEDKKIPNFKTALNTVAKLTTPILYKRGVADQAYNDLIAKYTEAVPITGRLSRKRPREPLLDIDLIFYRKKNEEDDEINDINALLGDDDNDNELHLQRLLTEQQKKSYKKYLSKKYPDLVQKWIGKVNIKARYEQFLSPLKGVLVRSKDKRFHKLYYDILRQDPNVYTQNMGLIYIPAAILIMKISNNSQIEAVDPASIPKRAADEKVAITYKYRTNPVDLSKDTFKEAIKIDKYNSHECWINTLYDFYSDSLFRTDKQQRYVITREKILEVINRTEEYMRMVEEENKKIKSSETQEEREKRRQSKMDIKNGLTWYDIEPFFR